MNNAVESGIDVTRKDVASDGTSDGLLRLHDNPLDSFRNGACLDLRVRVAIDLLTHSQMFAGVEGGDKPGPIAAFALDVATELFALAETRGLIEPLDASEGRARLSDHIRRQVDYQLETQTEQKRAVDQAGRIARSVSGAFPRRNG